MQSLNSSICTTASTHLIDGGLTSCILFASLLRVCMQNREFVASRMQFLHAKVQMFGGRARKGGRTQTKRSSQQSTRRTCIPQMLSSRYPTAAAVWPLCFATERVVFLATACLRKKLLIPASTQTGPIASVRTFHSPSLHLSYARRN